MKLLVLNASHQDKTVAGLQRAAKKASPAARKKILALAEALKVNPTKTKTKTKTKTPGTGRANAKGDTVAKHKARRRAVRRKTNPTNPTRHRRRVRRNPTSFRRAVAGIDLKGVVIEGAAIVGGELAQSFVQKQLTKMIPSMSGTPASLISSGLLAAGALYFGKGNKTLRGVAIGAAAGGIRGLAKGFAPSLFAGDDMGDDMSGAYEMSGAYDLGDDMGYDMGDDMGYLEDATF